MVLSSGDSQRRGVSNVKPLRFVDSMAKKSASEKSVNELSLAQLAAGLEAPAKAFADAVRSIAKEMMPSNLGVRAWGRTLKVDKSLASKLYRVMNASDLAGIVTAFPGPRGIAILKSSLQKCGCSPARFDAFNSSARNLQRCIDDVDVNRETLCAIAAGGRDTDSQRLQQRKARQSARSAMALIWGVEADARISSNLIAPSKTKGFADVLFLGLYEGFRQLRPNQPWCLYSSTEEFKPTGDKAGKASALKSSALRTIRDVFLLPDEPFAPMIGELSDEFAHKAIAMDPNGNSRDLYFHGDRLARGQSARMAVGEIKRAAGEIYATHPNDLGSVQAGIGTPIKLSILEILFHKDIARDSDPSAALFASLAISGWRRKLVEPIRLPLEEEVSEVPVGSLPRSLAKLLPTYHRLLTCGADAAHTKLQDYRCFRITIKNPPLLSTIAMRWRLAESKTARRRG